jgi:hypothetical protein
MPLLKGKENIGRNITTEEEHGKPRKQAVAIALNERRRNGEDALYSSLSDAELKTKLREIAKEVSDWGSPQAKKMYKELRDEQSRRLGGFGHDDLEPVERRNGKDDQYGSRWEVVSVSGQSVGSFGNRSDAYNKLSKMEIRQPKEKWLVREEKAPAKDDLEPVEIAAIDPKRAVAVAKHNTGETRAQDGGGDYEVTWTDRAYKTQRKVFKNDAQGAPGNGEAKARKFAAKLAADDARDKYGNVRGTVKVHAVDSEKIAKHNAGETRAQDIMASGVREALGITKERWDAMSKEDRRAAAVKCVAAMKAEQASRMWGAAPSRKQLEQEAANLRAQLSTDNDPELRARLEKVMAQLKEVKPVGDVSTMERMREEEWGAKYAKAAEADGGWQSSRRENRKKVLAAAGAAGYKFNPAFSHFYKSTTKKAKDELRPVGDDAAIEELTRRYAELKAKPTADLVAIYKRSHRISNTKGVPKSDLLSDIIRAEFGNKKVDTWMNAKDELPTAIKPVGLVPMPSGERNEVSYAPRKAADSRYHTFSPGVDGKCRVCGKGKYETELHDMKKEPGWMKAKDKTRAADEAQISGSEPADHLTRAARYEIQGDRARALDSYRAAASGYRKNGDVAGAAKAADGITACQALFAQQYDHPGHGRVKVCDSAEQAVRTAVERTRAGEVVSVVGRKVMPGRARAMDAAAPRRAANPAEKVLAAAGFYISGREPELLYWKKGSLYAETSRDNDKWYWFGSGGTELKRGTSTSELLSLLEVGKAKDTAPAGCSARWFKDERAARKYADALMADGEDMVAVKPSLGGFEVSWKPGLSKVGDAVWSEQAAVEEVSRETHVSFAQARAALRHAVGANWQKKVDWAIEFIDGHAEDAHLGFKKLEGKLSKEKGVTDPAALAASIGRKKYGAKGMAAKSAAGRAKDLMPVGDDFEESDHPRADNGQFGSGSSGSSGTPKKPASLSSGGEKYADAAIPKDRKKAGQKLAKLQDNDYQRLASRADSALERAKRSSRDQADRYGLWEKADKAEEDLKKLETHMAAYEKKYPGLSDEVL